MALLETMHIDGNDYTFQQLRHFIEASRDLKQEGVVGSGDYKVSQRAAGANLSVDVAAGDAWVDLDTGTRQGYYLQTNDGVVNVPLGAAHATLPRLDQLVLQINDSNVPAGSGNLPELKILAGTATSGATLDNRLGAASLGNDRIRFADIHVPALDTTISDSQIRDRRPWSRGCMTSVTRLTNAGGGSDYATTSSTFAQVDSVNIDRRIECSGLPLRVGCQGRYVSPAGGTLVYLTVDGSGVGSPLFTFAAEDRMLSPAVIITPTAGSHLLGMGYASNVNGQTSKLLAQAGNGITFYAEEIGRQSANN
jgi:hypothetical protein